ncbi:Poly(U)-binding-splicing factor PUF60 [Strongyloides ratti]|uniref:Poly(U)-binding-splicing factor PUF60 n=1 Tax=Strongyloides ratti TaxID=34506 RepID=A0A090L9P7_STRRB|nr:Poly(U)-binding-splicing factor PUF60 [Strongyloides ratti]CEF64190.1 Poly(U)-binding-splicing factor PUF60 [Strongyloides ratti]
MFAATFKPQTGPVFVGSGAKKEGEILGLGLPKLGSRQQSDLELMKRFAKDASVKHFLQQQNVAHQQNQQKVQMYAQALSLMARVYIGSISFEVREEQIKETFSAFGPIKSINMSWDAITGHHKGFAFLEFEVPEAAILAQETMNGRIMGGRNLKVGKPSNIPQAQPIIENVTTEAKKYHRVYVASVHPDLSETDLMGVFEPFGTIIKCQLAKQLGGKGHRGFGYLEYTTANAAAEAISALNNFDLGGMTLRVGKCITPPDALTYVIPSSQSNLPSAAAMAAASVTASIKQKEVKKTASPNENSPAAISNKPFFEKSQSPFTSPNECSNDGISTTNKPRKRRGFGAQVSIVPPPAVIANPLAISQSTTFASMALEEKSMVEQNGGSQNNDCMVNNIKLPELPKPGEIATWTPVSSSNFTSCNLDNNTNKKEDEEMLSIQHHNDSHSTALVACDNSIKNSTNDIEYSKSNNSEEEEKHKSKRSRRGKSSKKHKENDHETKNHKKNHISTNSIEAIKKSDAVNDQINQVKLNNEEVSLAHQEKCEIKGNEARYLLMNKLMKKIKSSVVVLRNMVTLPEVDDLLEHEIKEECSKYGEIKDICLFNEPETINVRVFILFRSPEEAECAKNALDKRFFACKKISASIYDQILFESGDYMGVCT